VLAIFERTRTKAYCSSFLAEHCQLAHEALANVPRHSNPVAARALDDMETLVAFVEETAKN
jgi:geranylgeranyl diphosphate synthase, type I